MTEGDYCAAACEAISKRRKLPSTTFHHDGLMAIADLPVVLAAWGLIELEDEKPPTALEIITQITGEGARPGRILCALDKAGYEIVRKCAK